MEVPEGWIERRGMRGRSGEGVKRGIEVTRSEGKRLLTVVLLADGEADEGDQENEGESEGKSCPAAARHDGCCSGDGGGDVSRSPQQNAALQRCLGRVLDPWHNIYEFITFLLTLRKGLSLCV